MGNDTATLITVTPRAAERVLAMARKEGREDPLLRLRVVAGGCSGFSYELGFAQSAEPDDIRIGSGDVTVLIDPRSAPLLEGSVLDFSDALLGGGLKVRNPHAVRECGCGESFSIG
jgi:iron-sulfur cluster assembly protein